MVVEVRRQNSVSGLLKPNTNNPSETMFKNLKQFEAAREPQPVQVVGLKRAKLTALDFGLNLKKAYERDVMDLRQASKTRRGPLYNISTQRRRRVKDVNIDSDEEEEPTPALIGDASVTEQWSPKKERTGRKKGPKFLSPGKKLQPVQPSSKRRRESLTRTTQPKRRATNTDGEEAKVAEEEDEVAEEAGEVVEEADDDDPEYRLFSSSDTEEAPVPTVSAGGGTADVVQLVASASSMSLDEDEDLHPTAAPTLSRPASPTPAMVEDSPAVTIRDQRMAVPKSKPSSRTRPATKPSAPPPKKQRPQYPPAPSPCSTTAKLGIPWASKGQENGPHAHTSSMSEISTLRLP